MIRIYCQYSYGGFNTFFIEGAENEAMDKKVNKNNTFGRPDNAKCFFQYGGCKMAYCDLGNSKLTLVIREIPSIHKDGDGRSIPCAVQFIGDTKDRSQMDAMAIYIANNINAFEDFFANLFYVRNGLHIEGERLSAFVNQFKNGVQIEGRLPAALSNIEKKDSGIFLFVPLSPNFGHDSIVTDNVCRELSMDKQEARKACLSPTEFYKMQQSVQLTVSPTPVPSRAYPVLSDSPYTASTSKSITIDDVEQLKGKIHELESDKAKLLREFRILAEELETRKMTISKYKKIIYALAGASAILLFALGIVGNCSYEKKNEKKQTPVENVIQTDQKID